MNDSEPVHFGASFKTLSTTHSFSNLGSLKSSTPKVFSYRESFEKIGKDHTNFWKNNHSPKVKTGDSIEKLLLIN